MTQSGEVSGAQRPVAAQVEAQRHETAGFVEKIASRDHPSTQPSAAQDAWNSGPLGIGRGRRGEAGAKNRACSLDTSEVQAVETMLRRCLFVIPSINGGSLLGRMLPSLRIPPHLVVVLDQGSTDTTHSVCQAAGVEIVQLDTPHTYTQAGNIGLELARERGCEYLFLANNDIVFRTDVARELLREMMRDPDLGVAAPTQLIIDGPMGSEHLAYRAVWNLEDMSFEHDFEAPRRGTERLEADFCELTAALFRISALDKIGFLDDSYGFYFEDADLGYRLCQAGYACAYIVKAHIEHYHSSTFNRESNEREKYYMEKNKHLFETKFLGYGINHQSHNSNEASSWNVINQYLHKYLSRYGLLDDKRPELIFTHPGVQHDGYLYTVWETTKLPKYWLNYTDAYKAVFAASRWVVDILREAGFQNVHYVPLGIESDVFQPWGEQERFYSELTFLWFATNQYRKGLDVMLGAWSAFHRAQPDARLVLMGHGIADAFAGTTGNLTRWGNFKVLELSEQGISIYEALTPISAEELAVIYRSVDFSINSSRAEGFGFVIGESMACGTPAVFGNFGAAAEFAFPGALMFSGRPIKADYSDKGFGDVGEWFEPDMDELIARLHDAAVMDDRRYSWLSQKGVLLVRAKFSWRNTVMALREALSAVQERSVAGPFEGETHREGALNGYERAQQQSRLPPAAAGGDDQGSLRRFSVRTMRRSAYALTLCADALDTQGWRAALATGAPLIRRYLSTRLQGLTGRALRVPSTNKALEQRGFTRPSAARRNGVLFIGYVEAALGLGETARAMITAATMQEIEFGIYPFNVGVEDRYAGPFMQDKYQTTSPFRVNVIHLAGDQLENMFNSVPKELYSNSYNILSTYWELPQAPHAWRAALGTIDEIWTPNEFVRGAFSHIFDGPITLIPPCVDVRDTQDIPTAEMLGLAPERFRFFFSFDYHSSPYRKNPLGVVRAFADAFPEGSENVSLVIKSTGAEDGYPEIARQLRQAAERDSRIEIVHKNVTRREMLGLLKRCQCYVSLHRSEGFGAGMVEAMGFGNAVIGTAFSGSAEFLNEDVAYPVSYVLRKVEPHEYPWSEGQTWAEPDHEVAVRRFREVYNEPGVRARKGEAACSFVRQAYSLETVGSALKARLDEILARR